MTINNWDAILYDLEKDCRESTSHSEFIHKNHIKYESVIFDILKARYLTHFKQWWKTYSIPLISSVDKSIVLYETRCHPNLEFLIYNATYFARNWGLIIYCSIKNVGYIHNILGHNRYRAIIHIIDTTMTIDDNNDNTENMYTQKRDTYNFFYKSNFLWNHIPCKYVLCMEIDSYLRDFIPSNIGDYDYICSKWVWNNTLSGGGGITIRSVKAMQKLCNTHSHMAETIWAQDVWAAEGIKLLNGNYNNSIFVESNHTIKDCVGLHQWWTFIHPSTIGNFKENYDRYITLKI